MKRRMMMAAAAVGIVGAMAMAMGPGDVDLVVHEWGTFTSVAASDGVPIQWDPLQGPDDLPSFVYGPGRITGPVRRALAGKWGQFSTVRMETPVIYFYGNRPVEVSAKVEFPQGKLTEWYPAAKEIKRGLEWGPFTVVPGSAAEFPRELAPSHYYPARETDAAPVVVGKETEKFLFYRGVGTFPLPVRVTLDGARVTVKNLGPDVLSRVYVFESRDGKRGFRVHEGLKNEATVDRPELGGDRASIQKDLVATLVAEGLYEKEARAMVKTWEDTWFEEGLRVFYVVPRKVTDAVLPLAIAPKPARTVRVLVARAEVLTPEFIATVDAVARRLADSTQRAEASRDLAKLGRFAMAAIQGSMMTKR